MPLNYHEPETYLPSAAYLLKKVQSPLIFKEDRNALTISCNPISLQLFEQVCFPKKKQNLQIVPSIARGLVKQNLSCSVTLIPDISSLNKKTIHEHDVCNTKKQMRPTGGQPDGLVSYTTVYESAAAVNTISLSSITNTKQVY